MEQEKLKKESEKKPKRRGHLTVPPSFLGNF